MRFALILAASAMLFAPIVSPSAALAQRTCMECTPVPSTGGGGGGGDGGSHSQGEPFNPFDDGQNKYGNPKLPGYVAGLPVCKTKLGQLRSVRASAVEDVMSGVQVIEICADRNLFDQPRGVRSIRAAIGRNQAMQHALRNAGAYSADDVVAVVLDGKGAQLYVHRDQNGAGGASAQ